MERIEPPWSQEQVKRLNEFQTAGNYHPFTCGNDSDHVLVAQADGWVCPSCDYRQYWAHAFMAQRTHGGAP